MVNVTLNELIGNEIQLWNWLVDEEKPEDAVLDAFEFNEEGISHKLASYARVISNGEDEVAAMLAKADSMQKKVDALKASAKAMQNKMDRMSERAADAMKIMGVKKLESDGVKMRIQAYGDGSVEVTDPSVIDDRFLIPQDPKIDRKALKAWMKEQGVAEILGAKYSAPVEKFKFKF